jgi:hypothetical protein
MVKMANGVGIDIARLTGHDGAGGTGIEYFAFYRLDHYIAHPSGDFENLRIYHKIFLCTVSLQQN